MLYILCFVYADNVTQLLRDCITDDRVTVVGHNALITFIY